MKQRTEERRNKRKGKEERINGRIRSKKIE